MMDADAKDKLYITELINDLHRNGFVPHGKAWEMLHVWSRELKGKARNSFPASKLRRTHADWVGKEHW